MNVRLMVVVIFALFVMPLFFAQGVSAFAENPIPYWDDDSLDVDVSWDDVEQTVDIAWANDSAYWEDCSDVSDWANWIGPLPTSDGDILHWSMAGDNSYDLTYSNSPNLTVGSYTIQFKAKSNTTTTYLQLQLYTLDDRGLPYITTHNGLLTDAWIIYEYTFSHIVECIVLYAKDTTAPSDLQIDYIRIWDLGDLDIGVPLIQQPIQSVELMGNFSELDSTVRFQMYDDNTASGLWCDVNSTQVTFPDASYAEFTDLARINFSLNEEIRIFTIYVYEQDTTLIDYYSSYEGLANKDYLRMTDSAFNGSYQLLYFLEEVIDMPDNIFYLLFLSLDVWGYLGPMALVVAGYVLAKKDRALGVIAFIVQCLFAAQYFVLIETTPAYWWHVIIILLGSILTCVVPLMDKR